MDRIRPPPSEMENLPVKHDSTILVGKTNELSIIYHVTLLNEVDRNNSEMPQKAKKGKVIKIEQN